jgi:hypothetical protein
MLEPLRAASSLVSLVDASEIRCRHRCHLNSSGHCTMRVGLRVTHSTTQGAAAPASRVPCPAVRPSALVGRHMPQLVQLLATAMPMQYSVLYQVQYMYRYLSS